MIGRKGFQHTGFIGGSDRAAVHNVALFQALIAGWFCGSMDEEINGNGGHSTVECIIYPTATQVDGSSFAFAINQIASNAATAAVCLEIGIVIKAGRIPKSGLDYTS